MKYLLSLCFALAILVSCTHKHEHAHNHESGHVHGADCNHDHEHEGELYHNHDHEQDHKHESGGHDHGADAIIFTPEQAAKIDFEVAQPEVGSFGQIIKTTAQVQSSQSGETILTAKAAGAVLFSGNLTEGQAVGRNQTLFSITSSGTENNLSVRFAEAKSNYEKAESAYLRAEELIQSSLISQREYQDLKAEYEIARSVYNNLSSSYSGLGQRVTSPIAGYVKELFVSNGEYVGEGQALMSVASDRTLQLRAEVAPRYASVLPYIQDVVISTRERIYDLKDLNGKVLSSGRTLTEGNYMLPVIFQIENRADLLTGSFVDAYIKIRSVGEVMTLPNTALTEEQGLFFVYIQLCGESYERRQVAIGASDGKRTEIVQGLQANERVVTRGALSVKLAQSSGALDPHAGHVH